ncbi:microtubule-actin cross-linking factor isoforms 1 2 3 5-like [Brachionus plicatilis]|uniref:Microtubule-actin cross-linking factor isoforms 1 2 3 5-like n=1 Tax=Brachionus plicatilis TaxID=10195 RepID=A0A3M7T9F0_BRAPC|nr:microtubule-actin cross-linking factor isoforms 1 2 3 5-like [Brachionus plicatilis]
MSVTDDTLNAAPLQKILQSFCRGAAFNVSSNTDICTKFLFIKMQSINTSNFGLWDKKISISQVHITFDNAERLIEKYNQDQFARYDLIHSLSSSQNNYYYYDTIDNKNLLNIDTPMEPTSPSKLSAIAFIDAVNRKQLDLETGMFKDPATNTFSLSLAQALHNKLLDGKSAHITEPHSLKSSDLLESVNTGLITSDNQVALSANFTLSLADALKTGHLKIGEASAKNCSITSETQSMCIRSVRDARSGEFLPPTEAIKQKLLDPYQGVFFDAANNEHMAISEAVQKGHVLVEANAAESASRDRSVVSTSLIRETKSYHLVAVFDPSKNDEISIKEAIERGVLDRKRGLYVHPQTGHTFSISDAINKGVIRARLLDQSSPSGPARPSYQTLVSTSRFEENRSYTITGAVDPRTRANISLFQAIKDGIIDPKNGTYVNITNGQAIPINKAIDIKLVLTDAEWTKPAPVPKPPSVQIKTLNIELVKDPRTARNISVSEAMQIGLLDKNTLHYHNPLTRQSLALNRAYEQGLIMGHYSEGRSEANVQQSYFIVDVYDPASNKSLDLDEAIRQRLFDHSRAVYVHPVSGQEMSIGEAVRKGLINAQIFAGDCEPRRFDPRLPVAHFGIDKKIRSVRTKFNKDGTSVLQIDIESTKPVKGVYEVDEIEEVTCTEPIDSAEQSTQRQVVDINSVHCVSEQQQQTQVAASNFVRDKNVVNIAINKEIGARVFDIERIEDVLDEDRPGVIRINVDKNNNKKIVERKNVLAEERSERVQPLIIDDSNCKQNLISIDGQRHVHKNEVQVGDSCRPSSELFSAAQQSVYQLDERLRTLELEKSQQVKVKSAEIVDNYAKRQSSYCNIEPDVMNRQRRINVTVDIKTETKAQRVPVQEIYEPKKSEQNTKHVYEDTTIVDKIDVQLPPARVEDDDEEETFDEWTEVYTITIRGVRYKIIWVYDALKGENVTLVEAIKRGILDLKNGVYHNLKTSHSLTVNEAVDERLVGIEQDNSAMTIKVNGITYTIYWVWDPVKRKRISPQRAIDRKVLDLKTNCYRNYANNETISIHEAVYMKLIGASDDLTNIEQELTLSMESGEYRICWVKDSRTGEKHKPREALRRGLLDLTNYFYNKYDTNQTLTIRDAIRQGFVGLSDATESPSESSSDSEFERQDSLSSLDDEELTIKTKTAIYVITGLVHPETQKEIKVSEAIKSGILNKDNGFYKDFKTNVTYEVGEAINEGFVFATVTDLLQDETASTEFVREEVKKFIVKSVVDPRTKQRIGGLQAQAAGILNYAQGVYTDPDTGHTVSIAEAIGRNLIQVTLQEETCHEEFDAEVITETLMERTTTVYRITGVLDPFTNDIISASDAVHRQIIDTETNSYIDGAGDQQPVPIKEAVRRNLIRAQVTERIERKPLGVSLQNAIRLGLFNVETGKFKDLYTNTYFDLNEAVEKGHVNANGAAVAHSSTGSMTLNEAFKYSVFDKKSGVLDRTRLAMFNAKIVEAKIYKWNFEDAVKCGLVSLKNAKYKHQQSGELMSIKEAVKRGLIDGESVVLDDVLTGTAMTLRQALDTKICIDSSGQVVDAATSAPIMSLEQAFNTRKIYSAFDENTGEIFLVSTGKLVAFEKAVRKNKMDKSIRVFDPRSNKDLSIGDALERCLLDKTSGMVIDPKGCGGLLSIKEAVKRGILSITGAPLVTGHHNSETVEPPVITSRKSRHILHNFDEINEPKAQHGHARRHKQKSEATRTPIVYDAEYLSSDLIRDSGGLVDRSAVTNVRLTNEEHRKRTSASGVKETLKADFKETVIRPGQLPVVTSSANYEKEYKRDLDGDDSAIKNLQTRFSVKSSDQGKD